MVQVRPTPSWETQLSPGDLQARPLFCPRCSGCATAPCGGSPLRVSCSLSASQQQTTTDWYTYLYKRKSKTRNYIPLLSKPCCTFISFWIQSLLIPFFKLCLTIYCGFVQGSIAVLLFCGFFLFVLQLCAKAATCYTCPPSSAVCSIGIK